MSSNKKNEKKSSSSSSKQEVIFLPPFVCYQGQLKKLSTTFDEFFGEVGYVTD